jgi:hypothetical protein
MGSIGGAEGALDGSCYFLSFLPVIDLHPKTIDVSFTDPSSPVALMDIAFSGKPCQCEVEERWEWRRTSRRPGGTSMSLM